MQAPEVPLQIDREKWIDALESLGIPVRGHHMVTLEADSTGITVAYNRVNEDGRRVACRGRKVARVQFDVGLVPVNMWAKAEDGE